MGLHPSTFVAIAGGHSVHGTCYTPEHPVASVVVQGAIGMEQTRYARLAEHLSSMGFRAITYDYSGTGRSRTGSPAACVRRPTLWGREDQTAVQAWARRSLPGAPLAVLGHSMGGQILGFASALHEVDAIVLVSVQDPYVGHWTDPWVQLRLRALWSLVLPGISRVLGYVPGRIYGGYPLSRPTCEDGTAWATTGGRLLDEPGVRATLASFRAPVLSYSFSDDRTHAPREAVDAFAAAFRGAAVERLHITPAAAGRQRIGHFGFFSPKSKQLWDELGARLGQVLGTRPVA